MKKNVFLVFSACILLSACGSKPTPKQDVLKIKTEATQMAYSYGESFNKEGLTLEIEKGDGTVEEVTNFEIEGGNNLRASSNVIAKVGDLSVNIPIEIKETFKGKVTFVGDSLTAGHNWPQQAYPVYVKDYLPEGSDITVNNCGKNGASFKTFGQYNPAYDTTTEYQNSLKGNPDPSVITILLGTNDATNWANEANDFVADYTALVNLYRTTFVDATVIMLTSPKTKANNNFSIPGDTIVNEVNPLQRQLAEDLDCPLIDLSEQVKDMEDSFLFRENDGVHLTVDAAKLVAQDIAEKIIEVYSE